MASVDSRVVEMQFDKGAFERGVADILRALEQLNKGLELKGASKGFEDVQKTASRFSLANVSNAVTTVQGAFTKLLNPIQTVKTALGFPGASKGLAEVQAQANRTNLAPLNNQVQNITQGFSAMQVAAVAAFGTIVSQATTAGLQMAKSLSMQQVTDGFSDYELKIGATQTIMAGTGESIGSVTEHLKQLDIYADQTIYSLSDMVNNIGKFTNAGVKLPVAVNAMKGISNVAALSGASANEAARAMYNLGQAIGQGKVRMMDWKSVELANMGTKEFKEQLIEAAVAAGTLTKAADGTIKTLDGTEVNFKTFGTTLEKDWLSAEALTGALEKYADETTDIGKKAYAAAKDVKTFSMMMETLKAAAGTGWTDTFDIVIGNLPEATKMFTSLSNTFGEIIGKSADARNELLEGWKEMGGRTVLIEAFKAAWEGLGSILGPIKEAFREVFPRQTSKGLYELTVQFRDFAKSIKIGGETAEGLKRTFAGVFAVFSIFKQVVGAVIGGIRTFFSAIGSGSGGLLNFTGSLGDILVALDKFLKESGALKDFFSGLGSLLAIPVKLISTLAGALAGLFGGFDHGGADKFAGAVGRAGEAFEPLNTAAGRVGAVLSKIGKLFSTVGEKIGNALSGVGQAISDALVRTDFNKVLGVIQTGLLAGILLTIKKFFKGGDLSIDFGGGILASAKDALEGVSQTMQNMQQNLKANILLKIAAAMAIMAGAIVLLATVDADKLKTSLLGMAGGMGVMGGAMVALLKILATVNIVRIYVITGAFFKMALAMLAVAAALKILSSMNIGDTIQALIAMGGALGVIVLAMSKMPKGMVAQAAAITILAVALNGIAVAMKIFGSMSLQETGQGLAAMAGALVVIGAAMSKMPNGILMLAQAAALTVLAAALNGIAIAMKLFGSMSLFEIGKGLLAVGSALVIIGVAMRSMPLGPNMLLQAAALVAVSVSLNLMAAALMAMGGMDILKIGKGLLALGGALAILAVGLHAMSGAIGGAVALTIAAGALALLTPVLITLGNLKWSTLVQAFLALGAAFAIFALGGAALAGLTPVFIGLGAAVLLFGAGIALAGAGVLAFSTGIAALLAILASGVAVVADFVKNFMAGIPAIAEGVVKLLSGLLKAIADNAPRLFQAFMKIITSFIDAVVENAPKIVSGVVKFLSSILDGVITIAPKLAQAFTAILKNFLLVIIQNAPYIAQAFIAILNGLSTAVIGAVPKMGQAFLALITTGLKVIVQATPKFAQAGFDVIMSLLRAMDKNIPKVIPLAASVIVKFLNGLASRIGGIVTAGANLVVKFLDGVGRNLPKVIQAGVTLVIRFVNGVADAIRNNSAEMGRAGANLASAIIEGMVKGLAGGVGVIASKAKEVAKGALNAAKGILGIKSPSKEFRRIGEYVIEGFVQGLTSDRQGVENAFDSLNDQLEATVENTTQQVATAKAALDELVKARSKDTAALAKARSELAAATAERNKALAAQSALTAMSTKEMIALQGLNDEYDVLVDKLSKATSAMDDARRTRDDFNKSMDQQYGNGPEIDEESRIIDFVGDLKKQVVETEKFFGTIQQLRALGLNDDTYRDILAKGIDAQPLIDQMIEGGADAVNEINNLSAKLNHTADLLGDYTSQSLYNAGVHAAEGLVAGLTAEENALRAKIEEMAQMMVTTINTALGIQSPSKVFAEVGRYSNEGLIKGLESYKSLVGKSAEGVGDEAVNRLRASIASLGDQLRGDMDMSPTIRPILDLSAMQKKATEMSTMFGVAPISVEAAYSGAVAASSAYRSNKLAAAEASEPAPAAVGAGVVFNQYNNSPKALSDAEIYRNTKNQLSVAKGALRTS